MGDASKERDFHSKHIDMIAFSADIVMPFA
jgi:hypothetical protein